MGLFQNEIKTIELLATSIALISLSDLGDIDYTAKSLSDNHQCGLTHDFLHFLDMNGYLISNLGYASFNFNRTDVKCGSFGGRTLQNQVIKETPIIFIHGISDVAFGRGSTDGYLDWQTGFRSIIIYFMDHGWNKNSLYTTTWGSPDHNQAQKSYHSKKQILYLRNFIQAVLKYTKSTEVIVISHSMGVTLARKVIKGRSAKDHLEGQYFIGQSLGSKVKAFIGLGGMNLGLTTCYSSSEKQTCNKIDGLHPGDLPSSRPSDFLKQLNQDPQLEGNKIYTIWSKYDDFIGYECLVWGQVTSRIPNQVQQIVKDTQQWGHFHLRDDTGPDVLKWLQEK